MLLKKGADVNIEDVDGLTPLFYASWEGLEGVVEYFLKTGATVDASDGEGWTSLAVAADKGFLMIVRALLSAGADPNLPGGPENWTPLHVAAKGQGVSPGAKAQNFYQASSKEGDIIEALIRVGADVNVVTSQSWTPLHIAASHECVFAMRMLIRAGANTTARDKSDKTPEQLATQVSDRSYYHTFAAWKGGYPSSNRAQGCGSLVFISVLVMICGILAIVVS